MCCSSECFKSVHTRRKKTKRQKKRHLVRMCDEDHSADTKAVHGMVPGRNFEKLVVVVDDVVAVAAVIA